MFQTTNQKEKPYQCKAQHCKGNDEEKDRGQDGQFSALPRRSRHNTCPARQVCPVVCPGDPWIRCQEAQASRFQGLAPAQGSRPAEKSQLTQRTSTNNNEHQRTTNLNDLTMKLVWCSSAQTEQAHSLLHEMRMHKKLWDVDESIPGPWAHFCTEPLHHATSICLLFCSAGYPQIEQPSNPHEAMLYEFRYISCDCHGKIGSWPQVRRSPSTRLEWLQDSNDVSHIIHDSWTDSK